MKRSPFLSSMLALLAFSIISAAPSFAAKEGEDCNGVTGATCDSGLYCDALAGQCNSPSPAGKCVKIPEVCPKSFQPVCSCAGDTYPGDCERQMADAQKDHDGPCTKEKME
jgi:hypothetical protein